MVTAYPAIEMSEDNHTKKVDHEYIRKGTCCAFMFNEPLGGMEKSDCQQDQEKGRLGASDKEAGG